MVDPNRITNFNLTKHQLEETLLFWVCAAGKKAVTAAKCLEVFLSKIRHQPCKRPFYDIRHIAPQAIPGYLKACGIGCYHLKGKAFLELAHSGLNLRTCSIDDLEKIKGIGMKTSRCFVMHSRRDAQCAGLDTHILKFLRNQGIDDVPKSTPTPKRYLELEQEFLKLAQKAGKPAAIFDLEVWREYSNKRA